MKNFIRVLCLLIIFFFSSTVSAIAGMAPGELVESTATKMLTALKAEKESIEQDPLRIYQLVDEIVLPHFDFPRMAKRVLGKYWRKATPQQRKEFTQVFRELLVRTYANSLTEYTEQKITYFPVRKGKNPKKVTVRSEVELASGTPVEVAYSLAINSDKWKVYDIKIDGVSLVTNYRSSFSREIDQQGLDSLIAKLTEKNKRGDKK